MRFARQLKRTQTRCTRVTRRKIQRDLRKRALERKAQDAARAENERAFAKVRAPHLQARIENGQIVIGTAIDSQGTYADTENTFADTAANF